MKLKHLAMRAPMILLVAILLPPARPSASSSLSPRAC